MNGSDCLGCGSNCQMPCITAAGIAREIREAHEGACARERSENCNCTRRTMANVPGAGQLPATPPPAG